MNVKNGKMNFDGPSLKNAGNQDDPSPQESLRSSLMLINNADFGLSFKTSFGEFQTNLTYFVAGRDIVGASVRRELFHDASLELDYRVAPSENHTFLTLHLPFNY